MDHHSNGQGEANRSSEEGSVDKNEYDLFNVSTECKDFSKRKDISIFNMSDYRSCENCVHMSPDNRCIK